MIVVGWDIAADEWHAEYVGIYDACMGIDYMAATTVQLKAEIAGAGRSIRNIAAELEVDYTTLFKSVTGKRAIRLHTVFDMLDVLGVTPAVFFTRVQERAELERDRT